MEYFIFDLIYIYNKFFEEAQIATDYRENILFAREMFHDVRRS